MHWHLHWSAQWHLCGHCNLQAQPMARVETITVGWAHMVAAAAAAEDTATGINGVSMLKDH